MITRLAHICLRTDRYPRMVAFYRDIIGLPVKFTFKNDAGAEFGCYLDLGNRSFIEIFDHQGAAAHWKGNADPLQRPSATHYGHFCLESSDLAQLKAKWEALGLKVGPISTGMDHSRQMWITDPDGNAIELMEYTPDSLQLRDSSG